MTGWKRAHLLTDLLDWYVAGAFSRAPVPLNADAVCVREHHTTNVPSAAEGCWCGFSAHDSRLAALRYTPLTAPIVTVEMSGTVLRSGTYLVAQRQEVVSVAMPAWCFHCGVHTQLLGLTRWGNGDALWELAPACTATAADPLSIARLPIPVTCLSPEYTRWAAAHIDPTAPAVRRCWCEQLTELTPQRGLRHYLEQLWAPGQKLEDGNMLMVCRVCATRWTYTRTQRPVRAVRATH